MLRRSGSCARRCVCRPKEALAPSFRCSATRRLCSSGQVRSQTRCQSSASPRSPVTQERVLSPKGTSRNRTSRTAMPSAKSARNFSSVSRISFSRNCLGYFDAKCATSNLLTNGTNGRFLRRPWRYSLEDCRKPHSACAPQAVVLIKIDIGAAGSSALAGHSIHSVFRPSRIRLLKSFDCPMLEFGSFASASARRTEIGVENRIRKGRMLRDHCPFAQCAALAN